MKVARPVLLALALALVMAVGERQSRDVIAANREYHALKLVREMTGSDDIVDTGTGFVIQRRGMPAGFVHRISTPEGYNGNIDLLVAVDMSQTVMAVRVTDHRETPGLGDRIEHDVSSWIDQFEGSTEKNQWAVKPGGDFDAITGATITSRAVISAVEETLLP